MRNAGLEEAQAGIKIAGRNINNLIYAGDTTLTAESEEEIFFFFILCKNSGFIFILTLVGADVRNWKASTNFVFYLWAEQYTQCGIFIRQDLLFYISHQNTTLLFLNKMAWLLKKPSIEEVFNKHILLK